MSGPVTPRRCGPCAACCTALAVHEIDKPHFTPCRHAKPVPNGSCGIYERRPRSCTTFKCLWLRGEVGTRKDRPDRIGLVLATADFSVGRIVMAYVAPTGALRRGAEILRSLAEKIPVCIIKPDRCYTLMVPESRKADIPVIGRELQTANAVIDERGDLVRLPLAPRRK